jgi:hypothetical protein
MKRLFIIIVLLIIIVAWFPLHQTPSHDRAWVDSYERTPSAIVGTSTVTLQNVRDWNHSTTSVLDRTWRDEVTIPVEDIQSVWFGLSRFGSWNAVGHSYLSFELADGSAYTLSIEARREEGENYGAFKGLFNQYELWYGWGTERDFLSAAIFLLDRPLEYYRLDLTPAEAQAVFVAVAQETAYVNEEARFYNTLTANCTNLLAKAINQSYPDRVPYGIAWNLPGLSIPFLHKHGLINQTIAIETHTAQATVDTRALTLLETIKQEPVDFSQELRQQLAQ